MNGMRDLLDPVIRYCTVVVNRHTVGNWMVSSVRLKPLQDYVPQRGVSSEAEFVTRKV
jgi:hypothetical protein